MSDLISRSKMIRAIEEHYLNLTNDNVPRSIPDFYSEMQKLVYNQPTAFDTEKVVEQLEQYANGKICNMHRNCPYIDNDNIACENCGALGAIDIVKKGGVE